LLPSSCALSGKARAEAARLKIVHVKAAAKVQASDSYLWWPPCLLFMLLLPCHKLTRTHSLLYFAPNHKYLYMYIILTTRLLYTRARSLRAIQTVNHNRIHRCTLSTRHNKSSPLSSYRRR
jgi:hypothetical protein